ncbi:MULTISPECIES: 4-hydroxythreonine-4-phosphate dehydrogenase PdxA [Persicobacter]|uniref:4-hydroxythreonine-4-phosphate dehydrogenase n=1 Tax=Persicobacter diffluens TaxID=981 RepID=A0AAN4VYR7_9BACT|nr:4-hydroxythreonine-4-phosphate dehydrogenase PdxA [Persicobacter sp. CCB-QB2]GJM61531.1 4-hydroxythreonine-4-phosphate dehydrogenase [Persicobacter diffluens]
MRKESTATDMKPKVGISIGDINGIGPEVIVKALADSRILNYCLPVIYASPKVVLFYRKRFKIDGFSFHPADNINSLQEGKVNLIQVWNDPLEITAGKSSEVGGQFSWASLKAAGEDLKAGHIDALVTAPINKHNIQSEDFDFPGHTEYLTQLSGEGESLMLLCNNAGLRVGTVTGHMPIAKVPQALTQDLLRRKMNIFIQSLKRDFGISKPKLAVLGLNPHAGEEGLLGSEEEEVIRPVLNDFKKHGNLVYGPFPADGFFGTGSHKKFDGVLAMYHDQGLIPFKYASFDSGVNYTAGLKLVRTSPDHGTAYDIAGKGKADPESFLEALFMAVDICKNRVENAEQVRRPKVSVEDLDRKMSRRKDLPQDEIDSELEKD